MMGDIILGISITLVVISIMIRERDEKI